MKKENDELVKEERKPERLPYVKPMSWEINVKPSSLLQVSFASGYGAGGISFEQGGGDIGGSSDYGSGGSGFSQGGGDIGGGSGYGSGGSGFSQGDGDIGGGSGYGSGGSGFYQ